MATTASARPYTGADVPQGPAEVWIKTALPATGAGLVLHTDGSVDATLNTTAVFLGKLKGGAKWSYKPSFFEAVSDESAAPFRRLLDSEELTISGEWMEMQSAVKLQAMMVGATTAAITGPPATSLITLGGLTTVATFTAALVWTQPDAVTKFISVQLYKTTNTAGVEANISKREVTSSAFEFKALTVDTRPVGDRLGAVNIYT